MLDHSKPYVEKNVELARHAHVRDVKLQKSCGSGFRLFAVRLLDMPHHFAGVNEPITLCENKDWGREFTLNSECHTVL